MEWKNKKVRATLVPREHYEHILAALSGKRKPPKEYTRDVWPGPFRLSGGRVEPEQVFEYIPERDEFRQPTEVRLLVPREKRNLQFFLRGVRGKPWRGILDYLHSRSR